MQNNLWNHTSHKEPHETDSEPEARPVVPVFQDLKSIALEVDLTSEVLLVEGLHWDLVASIVFLLVLLLVECEVVFNWLAWKLGLLVLARREAGCAHPEGSEDRETGEEEEEEPRLPTPAYHTLEVPRNTSEESDKCIVVEVVAARTVGWEGSILDGYVLLGTQLASFLCN